MDWIPPNTKHIHCRSFKSTCTTFKSRWARYNGKGVIDLWGVWFRARVGGNCGGQSYASLSLQKRPGTFWGTDPLSDCFLCKLHPRTQCLLTNVYFESKEKYAWRQKGLQTQKWSIQLRKSREDKCQRSKIYAQWKWVVKLNANRTNIHVVVIL